MTAERLTARALNRATLARQFLLERTTAPQAEVVEHLVGLQAQAPLAPYYGLWSRMENFRADDMARSLTERDVVRMASLRGTIHLVTARDALALRRLVQPVLDRGLRANPALRTGLGQLDLRELAEAGRAVLEQRPLNGRELQRALVDRFPGHDPASLALAVRALLPLVQVPPRGLWGKGGQPVLTTAKAWLGCNHAGAMTIEDLVRRYLGAFGPATVADVQTWSGLGGLRDVVQRLRPLLRTFQDEHGRELFDLPDAPRPDPEVPAPVRLIAEYDNLLLSYVERTRVMTTEHRVRLFSASNGVIPGTVLIDGFVAGTWKLNRDRQAAILTVVAYQPLKRSHTTAIEREASRLLALAAPGTDDHRFHITNAA